MRNDPTYLGTVQNVQGATVSVKLDENTVSGLAFIEGYGYRIGQVGSFVRIPLGYVDLFGVVSQVGAGAVPEKLAEVEPHGYRWMTVQIVGEGRRNEEFKRGVSQYPTIGDKVHLVTENDLSRIYGSLEKPDFVKAGHLASAETIPALININKLLTRHSAVVGSTGTGKSTTVAGLITALSDQSKYPSSRIIVIDIHGEYATALQDLATVFRVNADNSKGEESLFIPYWAMKFDELLPVTLGEIEESNRGPVLEKITELKREALKNQPREGVTIDDLTVDSPVPFSIHKMWFDLHCSIYATHCEIKGEPPRPQSRETWALEVNGKGNIIQEGDARRGIPPRFRPLKDIAGDQEKIRQSKNQPNVRKPLEKLGSRIRDPRFDFLFKPGDWDPNLDAKPKGDLDSLLKMWLGGSRPITVLDLSGIPASVLTDLIGVLLRIIYDALFWAKDLPEGGRRRPLLVVLEEAHVYLNAGISAEAVKRIIKEGRKYGIGAMVVSQRPSEIHPTILSQCGTIIAMRLSNATDRSHVASIVTDNLEGLLSMIPVLRTGEAIILGEAVSLPVRTVIEPPPKNRWPDSYDPLVYDPEGKRGWNKASGKRDYKEVVEYWRRQGPPLRRVKVTEEDRNEERTS